MPLTLEAITEIILEDSTSERDLKSAMFHYKELLLNAASLDLSRAEHQQDIKLEHGIAIGLHAAASCLDDTIRTQKFIRGTKRAIDQKLNETKKKVHLLYAGTGPFATLIMPLLSHYSDKQLVVTLLELNPESVKNITKIIEYFGFENQVHEIRRADATTTIFKDASKFDILLSETMQHALQSELQVVICAHLLNQMHKEALLIPQSIDLRLVSLSSIQQNLELKEKIGEAMKFDAHFFRSHYPIDSSWEYKMEFKLEGLNSSEKDFLAITTAINVFENETIEWNQSGLTVPKLIAPMKDLIDAESIRLKYLTDPEPGFYFEY